MAKNASYKYNAELNCRQNPTHESLTTFISLIGSAHANEIQFNAIQTELKGTFTGDRNFC